MKLIVGDCLEVMARAREAGVDAIVTDPSYGLEFMGKEWDRGVPGVPFWIESLRVLKPGGYLLAFGGTRMFHRLMVAIEDAGFAMRDTVLWMHGEGFPKSHNLKGEWEGWGTALKPAWEPIIVARKPLIGTVAANVAQYGTGALNIDGCRIETGDRIESGRDGRATQNTGIYGRIAGQQQRSVNTLGRWPANVILDEEAAAMLDSQTGERKSGGGHRGRRQYGNVVFGGGLGFSEKEQIAPSGGGASRFFYCAKASKAERDAGLGGMRNPHPTVKPVDLMRYLVRLVTPPGGIVLDPFMGSGSTGIAAIREGFDFVGIDIDPEYVEIARRRIAHEQKLADAQNEGEDDE